MKKKINEKKLEDILTRIYSDIISLSKDAKTMTWENLDREIKSRVRYAVKHIFNEIL